MPGENNSREDFALVLADLTKDQPGADNGEQGREVVVAEPSPPAEPASRDRDDTGRFVARQQATDAVPADKQPKPQAASSVAVAAPKPGAVTAPVSWKPEEREGFDKMAPHHQQAILRREREMEAGLRVAAEARQFQTEFAQMVQPWLPMIQAENSNPLQAANHLFKMAHMIRVGTPMQKAHMVADIIQSFSVDHGMLAQALERMMSGAAAPGQPPAQTDHVAQILDQRLAPLMQFMQQMQGMQQASEQELTSRAATEMEAFFADPKNEFANDVKDEMGILLMSYAQANMPLSLSEAYTMCTMRHPTISKLIQDRNRVNGAAQQTAAARRALEAAASVSSSGSAPSQGGEDEGDGTLRSDIASAWRTVSARRQ